MAWFASVLAVGEAIHAPWAELILWTSTLAAAAAIGLPLGWAAWRRRRQRTGGETTERP
ncbi:MAG: hypothetical protein Q8Q52_00065 [Acidimicrobiia bacterium]|nr:hypothetical protein [Acidimicrobiia bacterium]